jgi:hypothetical protein
MTPLLELTMYQQMHMKTIRTKSLPANQSIQFLLTIYLSSQAEVLYAETVLLRRIQLTKVQRIYQLYFLIHYCCDNTRKVRAPNAVWHSGAPHMYGLI